MDPIKNILSYLRELCTVLEIYLSLFGEEVVFSVLTKKKGRANIGSWSWSWKCFDWSQAYNLLSYYNFMLLNTQVLNVQLDECDKCITNIWIKIPISRDSRKSYDILQQYLDKWSLSMQTYYSPNCLSVQVPSLCLLLFGVWRMGKAEASFDWFTHG